MLGVWIVFQTLTGLVLLFRDPIEHHAHPGLTRHGRGDIGAAAALDAVRRRYPGEPIGPLATPAVSDGVYVVEAGERDVYVDPARARINGARDDDAGFLALVERLHRRFLFDELPGLSGARLVALLGIGWLVLAGSGIAVRTRRRTDDPAGAGVRHRRLGLMVAAPMVLVVVTGIRLAVPAGTDRIWGTLTGSGEGRPDIPPPSATVRSADRGGNPLDATRALAALHRKYPDGVVARLLMPQPGDRAAPVIAGVSVGFDPGRGQHDDGGNTVVFLDQFSGATLWEGRPGRVPAARQAALLWSRPVHTGAVAGSFGELLWGWLALAFLVLTVSGWRARRARVAGEVEEPEPPALAGVAAMPGVAAVPEQNGRRQLRRRKIRARRRRSRAARSVRERRRGARRLQRRRKYQARIRPLLSDVEPVEPPLVEAARPEPAVEIDLREPAMEIDLTEPAVEIDLTEAPVVYDSTITLETGETVESGIVGPAEPG